MYYNSPSPTAVNHSAGWLPHAEGLYTQHDDLLYQCMYIILHKERQRLGILNPFARPFYPATERFRYMEQQENEENNGKRDSTGNKKTEITAEDPIWIKVNKKKETVHNFKTRKNEQRQSATNRYEILSYESESEYEDAESSTDSTQYMANIVDDEDNRSSSSISYIVEKKTDNKKTIKSNIKYEALEREEDENWISSDEEDYENQKGTMGSRKEKIENDNEINRINELAAALQEVLHCEVDTELDKTYRELELMYYECDRLSVLHTLAMDEIEELKHIIKKLSAAKSNSDEVLESDEDYDGSSVDDDSEQSNDDTKTSHYVLGNKMKNMGPGESSESVEQCNEFEEESEEDFDLAEFSRLAEATLSHDEFKTKAKEISNQLERLSCDMKHMTDG